MHDSQELNGEMRLCSLLSEGFILIACVSVGGGLLDNGIVKILPGPALSLLQMVNVHLAHYILHSITSHF